MWLKGSTPPQSELALDIRGGVLDPKLDLGLGPGLAG